MLVLSPLVGSGFVVVERLRIQTQRIILDDLGGLALQRPHGFFHRWRLCKRQHINKHGDVR